MSDNEQNIIQKGYEFTCPNCGSDDLIYLIPGHMEIVVTGCDYDASAEKATNVIFDVSSSRFVAESDAVEQLGCADCGFRANDISELIENGCVKLT